MSDAVEVVRRCFQAYVEDDRAALEAIVADEFAFTSPLDNRLDRKTYFERCWPNHQRIKGFEFVRLIAEADTVIVTYEGQSIRDHGEHRFRNTEVFTLRGDKIAEIEVYFGWSLPHEAKPGGFVDG
jgi:ketosteroid isomerase-like protein